MVARNVMPFDTIGVEVVEDSNADFIAVTVVRLGFRSRLLTARQKKVWKKHELLKQIMCINSLAFVYLDFKDF